MFLATDEHRFIGKLKTLGNLKPNELKKKNRLDAVRMIPMIKQSIAGVY